MANKWEFYLQCSAPSGSNTYDEADPVYDDDFSASTQDEASRILRNAGYDPAVSGYDTYTTASAVEW